MLAVLRIWRLVELTEFVFARNNNFRIIISVVFLCLFFIPVPTGNLWLREAVNSSHTVLFFILSLVLYYSVIGLNRYTNRLLIGFTVLAIGMLLGLIIEMLQSLTQRQASLCDVVSDFYGLSAGLCLIGLIGTIKLHFKKSAAIFWLVTGAIFIVAGLKPFLILSWHYIEREQAFPVIADFKADWSSSFIRLDNAEVMEESSLGKTGNADLSVIRFKQSEYPGISIVEPESDWSGYQRLCFRIFSSYEYRFNLVLRVHDMVHNQAFEDRYNKKLLVRPGLNEFEINLSEIREGPIGRQMDLKNIAGLTLFSNHQDGQLQFELSNIYLD